MYLPYFQIIALSIAFSCVLKRLDDEEEDTINNAVPQRDEEIDKEDDPVYQLGLYNLKYTFPTIF